MIRHKKVKITTKVTTTAYIVEYDNGDTDLDELDEILEVNEYEMISDLDELFAQSN